MQPRFRSTVLAAVLAVFCAAAPWGYWLHRRHLARNFRIVEPEVLYRSGQLPLAGLKRLVHDYNIRTIVTLREADRDDADALEAQFCQRWGLNHLRLAPQAWWPTSDRGAIEESLRVFRKALDDPTNHPVLIHCYAGTHRTGLFCAIFRMDYQGWTKSEALEELRRFGYGNLDSDPNVAAFLAAYQPQPRVLPRRDLPQLSAEHVVKD
ncbi:MAG: dual specificity protein phosphatase family protein [Gemmataceae bacterium]|nr:dual specificity protein phosphatase family protein [Gemmataceae bacterium]